MTVLQVDTVELDLVEEFAGGLDTWFHIPTPGGLSSKRSGGLPRPDLSLRPVGTQPRHQGFQLVAALGDFAVNRARSTAVQASIPGLPSRGRPVLFRIATTDRT